MAGPRGHLFGFWAPLDCVEPGIPHVCWLPSAVFHSFDPSLPVILSIFSAYFTRSRDVSCIFRLNFNPIYLFRLVIRFVPQRGEVETKPL